MDYRGDMKRTESAREKIKKRILSPWQELMVKALNEISKDWLKELQTELAKLAIKVITN